MRKLLVIAAILSAAWVPAKATEYIFSGKFNSFSGEGADALSGLEALGWEKDATFEYRFTVDPSKEVNWFSTEYSPVKPTVFLNGKETDLSRFVSEQTTSVGGTSFSGIVGNTSPGFFEAAFFTVGFDEPTRQPGKKYVIDEAFLNSSVRYASIFFYRSHPTTQPNYASSSAIVTSVQVIGPPVTVAIPVPEPGIWAMLIIGIGAIGGVSRRRIPIRSSSRA